MGLLDLVRGFKVTFSQIGHTVTVPYPNKKRPKPLRFHGLYELGELPPGQLSCAGVIQLDLRSFAPAVQQAPASASLTPNGEEL